MAKTAEELVDKHTRRELEEMAEKLGITTTGMSKLRIAEALIEVRPKPAEKEVKVPEAKPKIGKKGVFAKQAAINKTAAEMQKGIAEMQKAIDAQIKENEKAAAKFDSGVKEMQAAIDKKIDDIQKGAVEMQKGVEEMQKGIMEFQNETMNYIRDFYYG